MLLEPKAVHQSEQLTHTTSPTADQCSLIVVRSVLIRLAHPTKIRHRFQDIKWDTSAVYGCRRWPWRQFCRRFGHRAGFRRAGCANRTSTLCTSGLSYRLIDISELNASAMKSVPAYPTKSFRTRQSRWLISFKY